MAISTIGTDGLDQSSNLELGATGNVGVGLVPTGAAKLEVNSTSTQINITDQTSTGNGNKTVNLTALKNGVGYHNLQYTAYQHVFLVGGSATESMRINTAGVITNPTKPAFAVRGNQSGSVASGGQLTFTDSTAGSTVNIVFNQGNYWSNTTSYFTAPVAGIYQFNYQIYVQNANSQTQTVAMLLNGAQMGATDAFIAFNGQTAGSNTDNGIRASYIIKMAAGDTTGLAVRSGQPALTVYQGHTWFQGYLIG